MKYIVFDVRADFAQFKKPFTTMSPQTFAIPTGTAVVGMISAIVGLDKKNYWQYFPEDYYQLALGVRKPIKKVVIPINILKTTLIRHFSRFKEHKRTTMEFIKDGEFRIWFSWNDNDHFLKLIDYIKNHETHYTLSLGLAWNLADYKFVGLFNGDKRSGNQHSVEINSVIRKDLVDEISFKERVIYSTKIPVRMKPDGSRQVEQYSDYLFDTNGKNLFARVKEYYELENGDRIVPL